jgi:AraC-like DNA-binding protein
MSKHFRIPSRLPAKLQELGIRASEVLHHAELPANLFDQARIRLTTEQFFALWRSIGHASSDPHTVLQLGTEANPQNFDPIGLAALSTASFGEAMRQVSSYKQLSCPEEIVHHIDGAEWRLEFRWLHASVSEPEALTDLCFAWVLSIARLGTGTTISPLRLELARPSAHTRILERHFGCPVHFGAAQNMIIFRTTDAAIPFITRNAELLAMLAPQLDEELRKHQGQETFTEHVTAAIQKKLIGRRPKIHDIARELRLSPRTLQRRLLETGLSFQQILEQARHQLARHYLTNSLLELNETAYLLGYEDANSFVRAFRIWEGVPPAHWREAQRTACHA